ncbi:MAG: hypothetical protein FWG84_03340 [Bacteroidales bacterium]|nr:hypothetical protein [Bacteroidales bacterium]
MNDRTFNGMQVFYTPQISEAIIETLGEYFIASGYADGNEKTAVLSQPNNAYELGLIVQPGVEQVQENRDLFKAFAEELCACVFEGEKVNFYLCDSELEPLIVFSIG